MAIQRDSSTATRREESIKKLKNQRIRTPHLKTTLESINQIACDDW